MSARRAALLLTVALVVGGSLLVVAPAEAAFPGANGKIAFSGGGGLYTVNPDGSGTTQVTTNPANSDVGRTGALTARRSPSGATTRAGS